MDKLKCPSFFKSRGKEVGVWQLWVVWKRPWKRSTEGLGKSSLWIFGVLQISAQMPSNLPEMSHRGIAKDPKKYLVCLRATRVASSFTWMCLTHSLFALLCMLLVSIC